MVLAVWIDKLTEMVEHAFEGHDLPPSITNSVTLAKCEAEDEHMATANELQEVQSMCDTPLPYAVALYHHVAAQ